MTGNGLINYHFIQAKYALPEYCWNAQSVRIGFEISTTPTLLGYSGSGFHWDSLHHNVGSKSFTYSPTIEPTTTYSTMVTYSPSIVSTLEHTFYPMEVTSMPTFDPTTIVPSVYRTLNPTMCPTIISTMDPVPNACEHRNGWISSIIINGTNATNNDNGEDILW